MTFTDRRTGAAISEFKHILQSIEMILTTRIGTRVMRRDFGSRLPELIAQPINRSTLTAIFASTNEAIARWEPRVRILRTQINRERQKAGVLNLVLTLEIRGSTQQVNIAI